MNPKAKNIFNHLIVLGVFLTALFFGWSNIHLRQQNDKLHIHDSLTQDSLKQYKRAETIMIKCFSEQNIQIHNQNKDIDFLNNKLKKHK